MWHGKKVSVIMATYREKGNIRRAIEEFFATGLVDEVVVVNNNAEVGTDEEVKKTKAKLFYEPKQGCGHALRKGFQEATGDYVAVAEPDGTIFADDLNKFLSYAEDFPAIFGTRTNKSALSPDSDMRPIRRLGNVVVAKTIEYLFRVGDLTDIGCFYRLFHKEAIRKIEPYFRTGNPLFPTEMMILTAASGIPFVEIPIRFGGRRVGKSTIITSWMKLFSWGFRLQVFILFSWLKWLFGWDMPSRKAPR